MKTASIENCKKLYELTGWTGQTWWHVYKWDDNNYRTGEKTIETSDNIEYHDAHNHKICPAYDLEYLLEMSPKRTNDITETLLLGRNTDNTGWSVVYHDLVIIDKTPVDAVCGLLIKLCEERK